MGVYTNNDCKTVIDKLIEVKASIKQSIIDKGGDITDSTPFEEYYTAVDNISGLNLQEKSIIPIVEEQTILPDSGYNGFSKVTLDAVTADIDSNIIPENIKKDVTILGVTGTYEAGGATPTTIYVGKDGLKINYNEFPGPVDYLDFSNLTSFNNLLSYCTFNGTCKINLVGNAGTSTSGISVKYLLEGCKNVDADIDIKTGYTGTSALQLISIFGNLGENFQKVKLRLDGTQKLTFQYAFENYPGEYISFTKEEGIDIEYDRISNINYLLSNSTKLKHIGVIDFPNSTSGTKFLTGCSNLQRIDKIDLPTNAVSLNTLFTGLSNLEYIGYLRTKCTYNPTFPTMPKLKHLIIDVILSTANCNMTLTGSPLLDYESIKSFLVLIDNKSITATKTLTLNNTIEDRDGELAALVASATSKGWVVAGLTLV